MKVLFLTGGARDKALRHLLENGINVVALVCPRPSKSNQRFANAIITAHEFGVPVVTVMKESVTTALQKLDFDVLLSCGFSFIIDEKAISMAKKIAINVHPTLLPKYRGFRSGPYIIINGEKESGITIHELTSEMDRGAILLQKSFEVTQFDTTKSVFRKAQELEPELILEALKKLEQNDIVKIPQDESHASEYSNIRTPKDSEINTNLPFKELYNFIRSCDYNDYPAHFYIEGQKVLIKLQREKKNDDEDII